MPISHRQFLVSSHTDPGAANLMKTTVTVAGKSQMPPAFSMEKRKQRKGWQSSSDVLNTTLPWLPSPHISDNFKHEDV